MFSPIRPISVEMKGMASEKKISIEINQSKQQLIHLLMLQAVFLLFPEVVVIQLESFLKKLLKEITQYQKPLVMMSLKQLIF